ncbi:hypothetical protein SAMN05444161_2703 [Rhizobiales bacterium GAS191]|jgi:hypothetical protein|nr:hypothetical protein SAMN05519103_01869 [Rhizobiales bacterium GAS113]SEC03822.1 hypothetical protein SAMN05519104_0619 [Rhizobiales bacterium GAS188]SED18475.1 hypothetical protein SAMN05444161_2703 [Rhizobiales bacterium GAS191]
MSDHLYRLNQNISLSAGAGINLKPMAVYKIVAILPARGDELQYRVKSDDEPYERVVGEFQIIASEAPAAPPPPLVAEPKRARTETRPKAGKLKDKATQKGA